ncbi:MAG: LysE/ArgO family amino acid transporter [Propionibacteriaceae bacterium]|jgi:L-lysine exporter family protein LysE/ArgO|nr:LysE/ArgO family amino acid transporter [Propionibacteriaceae bacterium]
MSLIVAIGAQNAFVLRQGIRREHVLWICLFCALADAVLITVGVLGLGALAQGGAGIALRVMRWAGAAFLVGYAVLAARKAWKPAALDVGAATRSVTLGAALAQAAAFSFLNPHVYLDTVMLLGSLANTQGPALRWVFALGAVTASFVWFFALGYGARLLAPVFAKRLAWRVLDSLIAVVMLGIAASLIFGG